MTAPAAEYDRSGARRPCRGSSNARIGAARHPWHFAGMSDTAVHQDLALAAEFPATDRADWVRLVEKALKDRPFDRLISKTYDGIAIEPLYARAAGAAAVRGRTSGQPWTVMQRIDHPDPTAANKQALDDLQNGANGLTLIFAGSLNANGYGLPATPDALKQTLDGIALDAITIDLNLSPATRQAVQLIADLVKSRSLSPDTVDLRASINPIGGYAASGATPAPWSELSKRMAGMIRALAEQGYRGPFAVADGRIVHNAGGSEAQELAFALAAAVDCLRALDAAGVPLDQARSMIYFRLAADADQFLTIAKFRAIRKLWARAEEACGLAPRRATVAAETAWRMLTQRDPYVNMLRTTIAVTAAGVGGADNIAVLPHTAAIGLPDAFARRVARNTQLVLLEEANLAKVADPAAGSGAGTGRVCRSGGRGRRQWQGTGQGRRDIRTATAAARAHAAADLCGAGRLSGRDEGAGGCGRQGRFQDRGRHDRHAGRRLWRQSGCDEVRAGTRSQAGRNHHAGAAHRPIVADAAQPARHDRRRQAGGAGRDEGRRQDHFPPGDGRCHAPMTLCARCRRSVAHPVVLGGMPFGAHCAALVRGPRVRKAAQARPDPRQGDLFREAA